MNRRDFMTMGAVAAVAAPLTVAQASEGGKLSAMWAKHPAFLKAWTDAEVRADTIHHSLPEEVTKPVVIKRDRFPDDGSEWPVTARSMEDLNVSRRRYVANFPDEVDAINRFFDGLDREFEDRAAMQDAALDDSGLTAAEEEANRLGQCLTELELAICRAPCRTREDAVVKMKALKEFGLDHNGDRADAIISTMLRWLA